MFIRLVMGKIFGLTICGFFFLVLGVLVITRGNSRPTPNFLPASLLPGNPLPANAICKSPLNERFQCQYYGVGENITLTFDVNSGFIVAAFVELHSETIGHLITLWGTPLGVSHYGYMSIVYWETRAAHLAPCSFQPNTTVVAIEYGLELKPGLPWRGFTTQYRDCPFSRDKTAR